MIQVVCYRKYYSRTHPNQQKMSLTRNWASAAVTQPELALEPDFGKAHLTLFWWLEWDVYGTIPWAEPQCLAIKTPQN